MRPLQTLPTRPHRTDIEGLRGVAVLAVTAVQAWPELLRCGSIGVDIFFVLSGYLISTLIFRAPQTGRFQTLCHAAGCRVTSRRGGVAYPMAHDESHLTADGPAARVLRRRAPLFNES